MDLRDATETDLPGVVAIYNDVLASSTAIFHSVAATLEDRCEWWHSRKAAGYPVLVATDGSGVLGFATFGDFRAGPGYRCTVEHSVHVRSDRRGQGVGGYLVKALFTRAVALGKHVMIAGVDAANADSIRFHERLGFVQAGLLHQVGYKFGRWLDLIFLQRLLESGSPS